MVMKLRYRRGDVSSDNIFNNKFDDALEKILAGTLTKEQVSKEFNMTIPQIERMITIKTKSAGPGDEEYKSNVQKIVSFKGVIRPITVSVRNKYGGAYKMRIINIYVKPNGPNKKGVIKEYTRYYEKEPYSVDKKATVYPEKANWSKKRPQKEGIPTPQKSTEPEQNEGISLDNSKDDIIQLRKRARLSALKRVKQKKVVKQRKCRCIKHR